MARTGIISKALDYGGMAVKDFLGVNSTTHISTQFTSGSKLQSNEGWLFNANNGVDVFFSFDGLSDIKKAYECCPPVHSIINKQAYAFINGKTWVMDADGKEAGSKFSKKLKTLLDKPNPIQNGKQFEAQIAIYMRLFGYCIILPTRPLGYQNVDAGSLWIIPPYMCEFTMHEGNYTELKDGFIKNVKVKFGNEETNYTPDRLIIIRDVTPGFETSFLPGSPIKPAQQNINNLIGLYNSKGALINYRGALGILSPSIDPNGAIAMESDDKNDLQKELMQYGLKTNQLKFIISSAAMTWQQIGISYKDLMLTEWAEDDTQICCDILNYPYRLLANTATSSMNGTEMAAWKKILYQDFVIPFAEMIYQQLGEAFKVTENRCILEKDYSHLTILQEDAVKQATARLMLNKALEIEYAKGLITLNQWLVKLGEDTIGSAGDIRSIDAKNANVPLATIIGTTGVQSFISVLTASGISEEARSATMQILFGISESDAAQMTQGNNDQIQQ